MKPNGDQDVRRRAFLSATVSSVAGLLADRLPGGNLRIDGEPLAQLAKAIDGLRYLDGRDGAATVLMPASWLAGRLLQALGKMPPQHEQYFGLAGLAADAAELAGWVAFETGEPDSALRWYDRAIRAAGQARDPDFVAFASEARARVLWLGLEDPETALVQLDSIKLNPITPTLRAHVHICRARVLAVQGNEPGTHRAIDAAMSAVELAASRGWSKDAGARDWITSPANVDLAGGLALADLGYGDRASELLTPALRRLPKRLRRVAGTVHRGLAQAAVLTGEPDQATEHAVQAHQIFAATGSRQLSMVEAVIGDLQAQYGNVRSVRELPDRLRTDTRYVLCRTSDEGTKVHLRSCQYARRGGARSWAKADHLDPAEVATSPLRNGYTVCTRCLPR